MRITINDEACIGAGLCVLGAEDVFDQREDDGIVVLLDPNPSAEREADVLAAARSCPVKAITVQA
jgi:ferredoxin